MKSKGVALIQVLFITTILSILAIQLNKNASSLLKTVSALSDRTKAMERLYSLESELYFYLLTERVSDNYPFQKLNYWGEEIELIQGAFISIQDSGGLMSLHSPSKTILSHWSRYRGHDAYIADKIYDQLLDWQDVDSQTRAFGAEAESYSEGEKQPTNLPINSLEEVCYLRIFTLEPNLNCNDLHHISTIHSGTSLKPYYYPQQLLNVVFGNEMANEIEQARANAFFSQEDFKRLTGVSEDEGISFSLGPIYIITIRINVGDSWAGKKVVLEVKPDFQRGQDAIEILMLSEL